MKKQLSAILMLMIFIISLVPVSALQIVEPSLLNEQSTGRAGQVYSTGDLYTSEESIEEPKAFVDIPFDPQRKIDKAWLGEIIGFSKVRVLATTSQEMTTGDHVKVTFSNEIYDTESEFDSTANRFTAKKVGYYLITCQLLLDRSVDDKYFKLVIYKNGAQEAQSTYRTTGTGAQGINITDILSLATGDYIEIYFYQNTGASIYTDSMTGANGDSCYLAIHKLS